MSITDFAAKVIGDKKRWRAYKARTKLLPENYKAAIDAVEHYAMYFGPEDGDSAARLFEDLVELFERAAADGTPIRDLVGDDPVEFADTFIRNYTGGAGWVEKQRKRLRDSIDQAVAAQG